MQHLLPPLNGKLLTEDEWPAAPGRLDHKETARKATGSLRKHGQRDVVTIGQRDVASKRGDRA